MERQTREERKNAIGFAMSGGGFRGISHIGAVKALYELGIRPQYVSGTSFGSAMAALVAMDFSCDEMKEFMQKHLYKAADFRPSTMIKEVMSLKLNKSNPRDGIKDGRLISDAVKKAMELKGIKSFHDLPINLSICTNDTNTTDECIFTTYDEGLENDHLHYITDAPLDLAVRASMSFPGVYTTCSYKQYNFIDGGSKDNLPVKILKDMGVGKVLAIGFDIMDYTPEKGLDGAIKVVFRALDLYSIDATRRSKVMADYSVDIVNSDAAIFSMDNMDLTIQEGYDCIMQHKDKLLEIFG